MKYTNEIKVGVLALLGLLAFVFGVNFLKSKNLFSRDNWYYSKFNYSAGLVEGAAVTVNNLKVGAVDKVLLEPGTAKIIVRFSVDKDLSFSNKSKVEIYSGFMGGAILQLHPVFDKESIAVSGDTLSGSVRSGVIENISNKIEPTQEKLNAVLDNLNQLTTALNVMFDASTIKNIQNSTYQLNQTMAQMNQFSVLLNKNMPHIERVIHNMDTISKNISDASSALSKDEIQTLINQTQKILLSLEKGEGSLGKLLKDDQLYLNLNQASKNLSSLLEDVKSNPKRYVNFSVFPAKDSK